MQNLPLVLTESLDNTVVMAIMDSIIAVLKEVGASDGAIIKVVEASVGAANMAVRALAIAAAECEGPAVECAELVAECVDPAAAGIHLRNRRRSLLKTRISAVRNSSRKTDG